MLISFDYLFNKYKIAPKGVIHIGASEGQEAAMYYKCGIERSIWIEAIPEIYERLKLNLQKYSNALAINACIGDVDGKEVDFNISSNEGQSSSYLKFGTHKQQHPNVDYIDSRKMKTIRIDTLLNNRLPVIIKFKSNVSQDDMVKFQEAWEFAKVSNSPIFTNQDVDILTSQETVHSYPYDFLNIDLQGCELMALKSMGKYMNDIKYAYIEVNRDELYQGCAMVNEIDAFMNLYGLERVETKWTGFGWGDALYMKSELKN